MELELDILAKKVIESKSIVILTGAGMSAESGLETFRGVSGYWSKYDPVELASKEGFNKKPNLVWSWYQERYDIVKSNKPHSGHYALTELQELLTDITIVTQNVDGYHQQSGSKGVLELHGSIVRFKCIDCEKPFCEHKLRTKELNICSSCYGLIRPDVVWFGESLPYEVLKNAELKSLTSELFVSIGTSSEVYPAAGLPLIAKQNGATLVELNPNETNLSKYANLIIRIKAKEILPNLLAKVKELI